MSLNTRMNAQKSANATNVATRNNLMKGSKSYRADCLKEAWLRVPGIREGMDKMDEATVRNLAINLDREATYIGQLNEAQLSTAFQGFAPENMLRLVRLNKNYQA